MSGLHRLSALVCYVALNAVGCHRFETSEELARRFTANRADWKVLLRMTAADATLRRIPAAGIAPDGMPESRFKEYIGIFRKLGVENGVNRLAPYPAAVFIIVDSEVPIGAKNRSEGFVHSPTALTPLVSMLPIPGSPFEFHRGSGTRFVFQRLDEDWYLFYSYAW